MNSSKIKINKNKFNNAVDYIINHELLLSLLVVIISVAVGSFLGYQSNKNIISNPINLVHYSLEPYYRLSFLANWDGVRYISIANHGYSIPFLTGFFPLYPILILVVSKLLGSALVSALIISWVCLFGAIYYYIKIIKLYFKLNDNIEALKGTLLFVLFPSGVYLIAAYTESLFALLSLAAIYYAFKRRYILVGLFSMFATATRINGAFVLLLVAIILFEEKEKLKNIFITLVIGIIGLLSYILFLMTKFKNPLEFIGAQKDHHWLQSSLLSKLSTIAAIDYFLLIAVVWTTVYWWKRRKSFAIYSASFLLIPLVGGQFGGFPRYCIMLFPMQFMLFEYFRKKTFVYTLILIFFAISWTYILLQYSAGYVVS